MQDGMGRLRSRLRNWGVWLNWEAEIGPKPARCISLESRYLAEAGELTRRPVWFERINSIGIRSCQKTFEYNAVVLKTRLGDEIEAKQREAERPGVIRNDPSKHAPHKNQDAQGAGCPFCGIRSTLG